MNTKKDNYSFVNFFPILIFYTFFPDISVNFFTFFNFLILFREHFSKIFKILLLNISNFKKIQNYTYGTLFYFQMNISLLVYRIPEILQNNNSISIFHTIYIFFGCTNANLFSELHRRREVIK